ncbi:MAG TPA: PASTA domain-containing protein [Gaiellaceae bacterium]|nr:PASTA domain-containing protein [Gaiellaceae bacterium]
MAPTVAEDESTARLPPSPAPPPPQTPLEEPPPDRDLWPWLVVLLVLVLAGLFGAWLASRHGHGSPDSATPPAAAQAAPASRPSGVTGQPSVPNVVGLEAPAALAALRRARLVGTTRGVFSARPRNQVVGEKPAAGARIAAGSTVLLAVSKGAKPVPVPDLGGQQLSAALATLDAQGLRTRVVRVPSTVPPGQVVAQHPAAGSTAPAGSAVRLNVSGGASTRTATPPAHTTPAAPAGTSVPVPDLRGEKINDARKTLREAGLVTEIRRVPNDQRKNTVVGQSPAPGTAAGQGDHVFVTVSTGRHGGKAPDEDAAPVQTAVPDVSGEDEAAATQDLHAAGFDVRVVDQDTDDPSRDGLVVDQEPAAGKTAPGGATVTVYVARSGG